MDTFLYDCQYCGKEYKPKKRYKQKFCSNSCRSNAFKKKQQKRGLIAVAENEKAPLSIEKMSWAGVGNAAVGTLAVDVIARLLTPEEDKPATKKDISLLAACLKSRYTAITNLPSNSFGMIPHFDADTKSVIYLPLFERALKKL